MKGVIALDFGHFHHYVDCTDLTGNISDLIWKRGSGIIHFPIIIQNDSLILDLNPGNERHFSQLDLDVYTCSNVVTGENVSLNFTEGLLFCVDGGGCLLLST